MFQQTQLIGKKRHRLPTFPLEVKDYENYSSQFWMINIPYYNLVFGENLSICFSGLWTSRVSLQENYTHHRKLTKYRPQIEHAGNLDLSETSKRSNIQSNEETYLDVAGNS